MSVIQFESGVEGNLIRIPEEYMNTIHSGTKVTVRSNDNPKRLQNDDRQTHRAAFEEFFTAIAEIDDEPLDDEFDAILAKKVNITRDLDL